MTKRFRILVHSLSLALVALCAAAASAAPPQPPDLRVQLLGPATAMVNSPYQYTVKVKNIGNSPANGVVLTVSFPETDTSPTKYILGTLSGYNTTTCQVVSRKLQCSLTNIGNNVEKVVTFNFALPVSTKTLEIKANATTTSTNEVNQLNNLAGITPALSYASNPITSTTNVLISMCTGRGLTSWFECSLFPSAQQHHVFTLNGDYSVTAYGDYVGTWSQSSNQQLHLSLAGGSTTAEFDGFATTPTCFEGLTNFTPTSVWVAPYQVCRQ